MLHIRNFHLFTLGNGKPIQFATQQKKETNKKEEKRIKIHVERAALLLETKLTLPSYK
jgi:hypothetical protein